MSDAAVSDPAVSDPIVASQPLLEGRFVHLVPMGREHLDDLLAAAGDRATFTFTPVPWDRRSMTAYIDKALDKRDQGSQVPFVTWSVEHQRIVGTTRLYDLDRWDWSDRLPAAGGERSEDAPPGTHGRDEASIGYTWLHPMAQRTPVNSEAKLLMISHAFDRLDVRVVRIQTDARNARSRSAIERLGFSLDGIVRADRPAADGGVRDTALYSMLSGEWPAYRQRLVERLALGV